MNYKFRAYDTLGKEMLPNVQNHINDDVWAFGRMLNNERFKVTQCIGTLFDQEAFVGDIFKTDVNGKLWVITYKDFCYNFDNSQLDKNKARKIAGDESYTIKEYLRMVSKVNAKVFKVGNIYDNKDLLV